MPRRFLILNRGNPSPLFVGAEEATTPASGIDNYTGSAVQIPVPSGVQAGDLMIACVYNGELSSLSSDEGGWSVVDSLPGGPGSGTNWYGQRVATGSEPSNYNWTSAGVDAGITGFIIVFRNATIGDVQENGTTGTSNSPFAVPTLTNDFTNSTLLAIHLGRQRDTPNETMTATSPLVEQSQHACGGTDGNRAGGIVAIEEGLGAGSISGREMTDPNEGNVETTIGMIIEFV